MINRFHLVINYFGFIIILINLNPNSNIDNKIEFIKFKPNQHLQYLNKISFENSP